MKRVSDTKWHLVILSASLLASVLLGFAPGLLRMIWIGFGKQPGATLAEFSVADQVVLTVVLFTAFLLMDVLWVVSVVAEERGETHDLWTVRNTADVQLAEIRHHFASIAADSDGEDDVFVVNYLSKFESLAHEVKTVAETREIRIGSDFFMNAQSVFAAFRTDEHRVVRYTWPIVDNQRLFTETAWEHSFEVTANMVESKKVEKVKVLLIVENQQSLQAPRVTRLLAYFKTNKGQEARIVTRATYEKICAGQNPPPNCIDFGIYGKRLLFRGIQYSPETVGLYSKDPSTVGRYVRLFDEIWESTGSTQKNPSKETKKVSLVDLFGVDGEHA